LCHHLLVRVFEVDTQDSRVSFEVARLRMSALVRITTGIMPNHSRVGMSRAMSQFGEVIHCHKPPYSGIPGEDFVNVRFGTQAAADAAYGALKAGAVFIDGFPVGIGPAPSGGGGGGGGKGGGGGHYPIHDRSFLARRSASPPRRYGRGVAGGNRRSPPKKGGGRDRSKSPRTQYRQENRDRNQSKSRSRSKRRENRERRYQETRTGGDAYPPPPARVERAKPARTPSPDPPGPVKNTKLVVNPFYRHNRSPSPDLQQGNHYMQALPADFDAP